MFSKCLFSFLVEYVWGWYGHDIHSLRMDNDRALKAPEGNEESTE